MGVGSVAYGVRNWAPAKPQLSLELQLSRNLHTFGQGRILTIAIITSIMFIFQAKKLVN